MATAPQQLASCPSTLPNASYPVSIPIGLTAELVAVLESAEAAFRRELPTLLAERPGQWIAYLGDRRLGFAQTRVELNRQCRVQNIDSDQVLFCRILSQSREIEMGPGIINYHAK